MKRYLPLFPLNIVPFPGEKINLHIFEPRYKDLINDVVEGDGHFGIPSFVENNIEYGTEVILNKIVKKYEDGRMDINVIGQKVFKVITLDNPMEGKLYAGGEIEYIPDINNETYRTKKVMLKLLEELFEILKLKEHIKVESTTTSYEFAHRIGLSLKQEYELLKINNEKDRQQFIVDHLEKAIPMAREIERAKEIIKMNGHFRKYNPLKF
jgi:Lon protease-like protein